MKPNSALLKVQGLVRRGHFDAAINICESALRLNPSNAKVNSILGEVLIHAGQNDQAAKVLEVAFKTEPMNEEHWIRLLAAQHRSGNLTRCRELLVMGRGLIPDEQLKMFAHGVSQPPEARLKSIVDLLQKKNYLSAEIAARMFMEDFPEHQFGGVVMRDIFKATGRKIEALELICEAPAHTA